MTISEGTDVSCDASVQAVKDDLAERGYYNPWQDPQAGLIEPRFSVSDDRITSSYKDYPSDRIQTLTFGLSADATRLYNEIMASPQLLSTMAASIMAECTSVGLVEFAHWWEGVVPIGYFSDSTARPFEWTDEFDWASDTPFEWGYYYSP